MSNGNWIYPWNGIYLSSYKPAATETPVVVIDAVAGEYGPHLIAYRVDDPEAVVFSAAPDQFRPTPETLKRWRRWA